MRHTRAPLDYLRGETVAGAFLLAATAVALVAANSPLSGAYDSFRTARVPLLHADVEAFAGEGLLSVFFFVAGLELKREVVVGELRERRHAALPVVAALCGMAVPALLFLVLAHGTPGAGHGWAVPTATDLAFALGVLALAGSHYPPALRVLLLGLAVVDDVGAIVLIAILFAHPHLLPLAGAAGAAALYVVAQRQAPYAAVPIAVVTWACVHAGGVHATVAAVGLALLTPVDRAERLERSFQPWSVAAVVAFAFTAAGLPLSVSGLRAAATDQVAIAVFVARLAGKFVGIAGGVVLAERLRLAKTPPGVRGYETACLGALGGVGFTVSLLLADLAYTGSRATHVKTAVVAASVVASVTAAAMLRRPSRTPRRPRPAAARSRR